MYLLRAGSDPSLSLSQKSRVRGANQGRTISDSRVLTLIAPSIQNRSLFSFCKFSSVFSRWGDSTWPMVFRSLTLCLIGRIRRSAVLCCLFLFFFLSFFLFFFLVFTSMACTLVFCISPPRISRVTLLSSSVIIYYTFVIQKEILKLLVDEI